MPFAQGQEYMYSKQAKENGFLIVVELFLPWCSFISLKILWLRTTFSVLLLSILANCLSSTNVCLPYEDVIFSCSQQPCEINWFNFRSRLILLLVNEGLNVISYSVSLIPVKCNHSWLMVSDFHHPYQTTSFRTSGFRFLGNQWSFLTLFPWPENCRLSSRLQNIKD